MEPHYLVAMKETVRHAMEITQRQISLYERVPPLVYACMARGGKTTFLYELFDQLQKVGVLPVFITFLDYNPSTRETALQSITRQIASQLLSLQLTPLEQDRLFVADPDTLWRYIDTVCADRPVVLLIDELNMLGYPLDREAAIALKHEWLDRKGRYLIFSSHVPLNLDESMAAASYLQPGAGMPVSDRDVATVPMPNCTNPRELEKMFPCGGTSVSPAEVAMYSGVPSLMYVAKSSSHTEDLVARFNRARIHVAPAEAPEVLAELMAAVITGNQGGEKLRRFYQFGQVVAQLRIIWPILYLSCMLHLFPCGRKLRLLDLLNRSMSVHAARTEAGADWEVIVQVAILLQSLYCKTNGGTGPFNIVPDGHVCSSVDCMDLNAEVKTVAAADALLTGRLESLPAGTILAAVPVYAKFPGFDGFVYFKGGTNALGTPVVIKVGYQVKLGRAYPSGPVPACLDRGVLVRGHPPLRPNRNGKWVYAGSAEIDSLLGASLAGLKPSEWPDHPTVDGFDPLVA